MTSAEFVEWFAFYELDPFGPWRDNLHAAQVASLLYNANRRKNSKALGAADFMYKDRDEVREQETKTFLANLRALAIPKKETVE